MEVKAAWIYNCSAQFCNLPTLTGVRLTRIDEVFVKKCLPNATLHLKMVGRQMHHAFCIKGEMGGKNSYSL
jgi:hypothetical protein